MTIDVDNTKCKLREYNDLIAVEEHERDSLLRSRKEHVQNLKYDNKDLENLKLGRDIVSRVGVLAQERLKTIVESLVTEALQAVFGDDFVFEMVCEISRNKPEVFFYVVKNGRRSSLKDELGGGVVDIVSFVLRVVMWSLSNPRSIDTLILDEPGKFVSKDKLDLFGLMISEISKRLGLQFIIVTHERDLIEAADKAFCVVQKKGISYVDQVV